ncbi:small proline-rich protein 2B-like isoform X1 [Rana temporaria]|uniref:small proline-rich protein 2B-like isoform X1 n=1 Tax=Rana temporaria TaxID=8407 RepID=UPI001AAD7E7D|nr:small proline-rich protein 2B-like isoform X1 [Rana temporaria]
MSGIKGKCVAQKIQCQDPCNPCQNVVVCKVPCQDPCKPHHHHHGTVYVRQQDPCNPCNPCVVPCCPDPCDPCQGQGHFCCDK